MRLKHNVSNKKVWRLTIANSCGHRRKPNDTAWIYLDDFFRVVCDSDGDCETIAEVDVKDVEERDRIRGHRQGNITCTALAASGVQTG